MSKWNFMNRTVIWIATTHTKINSVLFEIWKSSLNEKLSWHEQSADISIFIVRFRFCSCVEEHETFANNRHVLHGIPQGLLTSHVACVRTTTVWLPHILISIEVKTAKKVHNKCHHKLFVFETRSSTNVCLRMKWFLL